MAIFIARSRIRISLLALCYSAFMPFFCNSAWSQSYPSNDSSDSGLSGQPTDPSSAATSNLEPQGDVQPAEIPPGETQTMEPPSTDTSPPLPEPPPAELSDGSQTQQTPDSAPSAAPLPNQDAIPSTSGTFGPSAIPGYVEAMNAAADSNQAKGNKQLIESLRDVFPINGNPLKDFFTPQPQYVTPQTLMNPQPKAPAAGEANPLKGLFTPQPQYLTPQTLINPEPTPPAGEINHFKGVFTAQPQYPTPQTLMNPHPLPRYYVKERLPDHFFEKQVQDKQAGAGKVETQLGPSKSTDTNTAGSTHPLRQAMLFINSSREEAAVGLMDRVLVQTPGNFQARYVRAVALVRLRRFAEASDEYKTIMRFAPDEALKKLAQEGITKLSE